MTSSDSDSDIDWNERLFQAISMNSKTGPEIPAKERCQDIQRCLDQGAVIDTQDKHGDTVLHKAVKKGYFVVVKFLRKKKASVNISNKKSFTALTLAEKLGRIEIFEYLKQSDNNANQPHHPGGLSTPVNDQPSTSGTNIFNSQGNTWVPAVTRNVKRPHGTDDDNDHESAKKRRLALNNSFERRINSKPIIPSKPDYLQGGLTLSFHGPMYQIKHYMLILQRASKLDYTFHLAKEMDDADKFDDLVFEYKDKNSTKPIHRFLQFKHRGQGTARTDKISSSTLLNVESADFSLLKYFMSHRKINKHPELSKGQSKNLILCTNIDLDVDELKEKKIDVELVRDRDDFLKVTTSLVNKNPRCYKLKVTPLHVLSKTLKRASDIHCLAKALAKNVDKPEKLTLATDIFKQYHLSLADEVLDIGKKRFKENFVNPVRYNNLSTKAKTFNQIFLEHVKELPKFKDVPDRDIWEKLKNFKFNLSGTFGVGQVTDLPDDSISDQEISHFFEDFIIAVDQPNESQLTDVISEEIAEKFNLLNAGFPVDYFQTAVLNWFKEGGAHGRYLTEIHATEFFDEIQQCLSALITVGLSLEYLAELDNYGIQFEHENTKLQEFLDSNSTSNLQLLTSSGETLLLALSVHQTLTQMVEYQKDDSFILIKLEKLKLPNVFTHVLLAFSALGSHYLLIIDCAANIQELYEHDAWNSLRKVTEINSKKKLVVINQRPKTSAPSYEAFYDIRFKNLDEDSQRKLLEKMVKFQGQGEVRLGTIFGICDFDNVGVGNVEDLSRIIDVDTLVRLIQSKLIEIGSKVRGLNEVAKYYITRTISHFDINGRKLIVEDEFFNSGEPARLVIISDTAGMGKSTLLTKFATQLKKDPSLLVIVIDLSSPQSTRALAEKQEAPNFDDNSTEVDFLVDKLLGIKNDLESKIFKRLINIPGRAALLFDGFDEICPTYKDKILELLHALTNTNIKKLVVTTRPHTSRELAAKLGISSHFALCSFSVAEQEEFLIKFWKWELSLAGINDTIEDQLLRDHAQEVIALLAKSIDDRAKEFTGTPLQTRMVAEVYSVFKGKGKKTFAIPELPKKIDIIKLYRDFVGKKYDIYFEEKNRGEKSNPGQQRVNNMTREIFDAAHQNLSLDALFDEEIVKQLRVSQPAVQFFFNLWQRQHEGGECTGIIIEVTDGKKPHFIHRTFAEYFVAEFISNTLRDDSRNQHLRTFFLTQIFVNPENKIIRAFINCFLSGESSTPKQEPWNLNLRDTCDASGQTVYHVAAQERCVGIVRFFLNTLNPHGENQTLQNTTQFHNQIESCAGTSVQEVNEPENEAGNSSKTDNPMPPVTCSGQHRADINIEDRRGRTPLHIAVETEDNLDLVKCLVEAGANIDFRKEFGDSPVHEASWLSQFETTMYLYKRSANFSEHMLRGRTPLHCAVSNADVNLDVLTFLIQKGANINSPAEDGVTLLHEASKAGNLVAIKYILKNGSNINEREKTGLTALHFAACNPRDDVEVVEFLLTNGAGVNTPAEDGTTPLHEACKSGNFEIIKYLLDHGADIEARMTSGGPTPLHCAASNKGDHVEIVEYLMEKGADMNSLTEDGTTLLHEAASSDNFNVIILLLDNDANVNAQTSSGQTPMHRAASNCCIDVDALEYLIDSGANINLQNNEGFTPLHCAVDELFKPYIIDSNDSSQNVLYQSQRNFVKFLLNHGADTNIRDNHGRTPQDLAMSIVGSSELVQDLFNIKSW